MNRTRFRNPYGWLLAAAAWITVVAVGVSMSGWYQWGCVVVTVGLLFAASERDHKIRMEAKQMI